MRIYYLISLLCVAGAVILVSCSGYEDPDDPARFNNRGLLQVKAVLYGTGSGLDPDERMGIFVCSSTEDPNSGKSSFTNMECISRGPDAYWELYGDVPLGSVDATVFAYYPYRTGIGDYRKIPVDMRQTEDICFGVNSRHTALNREQPLAFITLRHAFAKIKFNLVLDDKEEYRGPGVVESARVVKLKPDGTIDEDRYNVLTVSGLLDASTGRVSTTARGKLTIRRMEGSVFTHEGMEEERQPYFYSCPETNLALVAFAVIVDGKQHILPLEEGTEWHAATVNTYTFRLKGLRLVIDQNDGNGLVIKDWEDLDNGEIEY